MPHHKIAGEHQQAEKQDEAAGAQYPARAKQANRQEGWRMHQKERGGGLDIAAAGVGSGG